MQHDLALMCRVYGMTRAGYYAWRSRERQVAIFLAKLNAHRPDREAIAMDILAGVIMLAVVLLFVGIALDAAYHK